MQGCIQLRLQPACIPAGRLTSCCTAWGVLRLLRADVKGLVAQKPNCSGEQSPSRNFRYWTLFASTLGGRMAALPISSQLRSSCHIQGPELVHPLDREVPVVDCHADVPPVQSIREEAVCQLSGVPRCAEDTIDVQVCVLNVARASLGPPRTGLHSSVVHLLHGQRICMPRRVSESRMQYMWPWGTQCSIPHLCVCL